MQKAARIAQARTLDDPFEDHCWKDVIPPDVLKIYRSYVREVGVGPTTLARMWLLERLRGARIDSR